MDVVEAEGLGKVYHGGTEALKDVSFRIAKGEVFCLLGRNGAGKTTLLRILATQLRPTTGRATVFGHDVQRDPYPIREKIAVVPQEARPLMMMSPFDHIRLMCLIRGMSKPDALRRTKEVMEELELWEHKDKLTSDLSGGLRQRVILGMALIADPEVLFLDEPTIGLDPLGRRHVWAIIRRLTKQGVTVLLTTHYMDEAEKLADRLAIIHQGKLAFLGTVDQAIAMTGMQTKVIVEPKVGEGNDHEVLTPQSDREIIAIIERSLKEGRRVTFRPPALEDAFIKTVGGSIDEEAS